MASAHVVLLTLALGLTAAAHLLAASLGFVAALAFMLYLAERGRGYVMQILIFSAIGALFVLFAFYRIPSGRVQLRLHLRPRCTRFWFSRAEVRSFVEARSLTAEVWLNFPIALIATAGRSGLAFTSPCAAAATLATPRRC